MFLLDSDPMTKRMWQPYWRFGVPSAASLEIGLVGVFTTCGFAGDAAWNRGFLVSDAAISAKLVLGWQGVVCGLVQAWPNGGVGCCVAKQRD